MAVSTLAAVAAGAGGMLAMQAPAHATETGANGLIWSDVNGTSTIENPDGSGLRQVVTTSGVSWSSDGSRAASASYEDNCGVVTLAADFTDMRGVPNRGNGANCYARHVTWIDDNTQIAFDGPGGTSSSINGLVSQLWVVPWSGPNGVETPLFSQDTGSDDTYPKAVGNLIAFTRTPRALASTNPVPQVWIYDMTTQQAHMVVDDALWADISPDGQSLVFMRPGSTELFTASIDGSNVTQLVDSGTTYSAPVWSPSGTKIAYYNGTNTAVIDLSTKNVTVVPGSGADPAWQPVNPAAPIPPGSAPSSTPSSSPSSTVSSTPSTAPSSTPSSPPPTTTPPPSKPGVERIAGADRFDTGVKISRQVWIGAGSNAPGFGASAVVLATGGSFPDALAGGPLAAAVRGPLLLTDPQSLPDETRQEIVRILPKGQTVYILGSTGAVSQGVENELRSLGYQIVRLGGADRFATSRAIATEYAKHVSLPPSGRLPVVLATGTTYADALPAGPLATLIQAPIVLTNGGTMDDATYNFIGSRPVLPVGGPAYQAAGFPPENDGFACDNLAGADRYATSADVANCIEELRGDANIGPSPIIGLATGLNYPDALTGGALMGLLGGPLLLTDPASLSWQARSVLATASSSVVQVELFGGTGALSPNVEHQVASAIGGVELSPLLSGYALSEGVAGSANPAGVMTRTPVTVELGKPLD